MEKKNMRKAYICPKVKVVNIADDETLMAGSNQEPTPNKYMEFGGEASPGATGDAKRSTFSVWGDDESAAE